MKIKDQEQWDKYVESNPDDYGSGVVRYAAAWAHLMELRMGDGTIADIAEQTSHEADTEGITGFMYGAAVVILHRCWEHGDELVRWHNRQYADPEAADAATAEGKIANPAIVTIG